MLEVIPIAAGQIQVPLPGGGSISITPDGTPGFGRSVELRGSGIFIGTALLDQIVVTDDGAKTIFGLEDGDSFYISGSGAVVFGNAGDDVFTGGDGDSTLYGGHGDERIAGGPGNDLIFGELGSERLDGEAGSDTLLGGMDGDIIRDRGGTEGDENFLYGGQGDDRIESENGNDRLWGDIGDDGLTAGTGSDTLTGGSGFDILTGNDFSSFSPDQAQDFFALEITGQFDLITDFEDGVDRLILPVGVSFEDLAIAQVGEDAAALDALGSFLLNEPTDILIRLANSGEVLSVLNGNGTGLTVDLISAEDFIDINF
ncbi:hemolysin-type calcium-binding repeat family protein [Lyngbya aestuarii BL J]|uniref:Hemolysin-type calcium-binding repeat family protein n=1 Tax=Lyngbya aestuarii BL J TaxID=1348334 RepID=U7QPV3_9CYAN|nr:calcium-binding protein [Lyngbya aestuarii]ERT08426.1 hemolysin-type calcium-binding repeat family protein [Lyngbya aestuarii BL J]